MTKCASPSCKGHGQTRNEWGLCEVCVHPSSFDPLNARIGTDIDWDREKDLLLAEMEDDG